MISLTPATLLTGALVGARTALAGSTLWDGRFNSSTLSTIEDWSWSNEVGAYQYYIHGTGSTSEYLDVTSDFKNPADSGSADGIKMTLDSTSYWNGQTMRRTELIPQTKAAINTGKVYYHFSMKHATINPPNQQTEHQIAFFESHFTEMKSGLLSGSSASSSNALYWMVNSESQWNISDWTAGVWHNIAYGIDFDANTVEFYHSTGADDLALAAGPFTASTSSNGADWHLGALRLAPSDSSVGTAAEDFYFSGVYIESGDITLSVSGPGSSSSSASSSSSSSASSSSAAVVASSSSTPATSASSSSSSSVAAVSTAAAVATTSSTSTSAAPTTLQTVVKSSSAAASMYNPITTAASSSSSAAAAAATTAAEAASTTPSSSEAAAATTSSAGGDEYCAVEYVYV